MSYIDREQLIDMFQQLAHDDWNQRVSTTWANAYSDATEMVRDIPSADVEPVRHGHWIMLHKTHGVEKRPNNLYPIKFHQGFCYRKSII